MPRPYHKNPRCPRWNKGGAPLRVCTLAQPGSERWRRRISEKAYRERALGPPISPGDTIDWREQEYRFLYHHYQSNDGCRYWKIVNEMAGKEPDCSYRVGQQRFAALRQRLVNERKLVRVSKGYRLLLSDAGARRLREIAGVSPDLKLPKTAHRSAAYDSRGTCGLHW